MFNKWTTAKCSSQRRQLTTTHSTIRHWRSRFTRFTVARPRYRRLNRGTTFRCFSDLILEDPLGTNNALSLRWSYQISSLIIPQVPIFCNNSIFLCMVKSQLSLSTQTYSPIKFIDSHISDHCTQNRQKWLTINYP